MTKSIKIISIVISIGLSIILFTTLNCKNYTNHFDVDGINLDSLSDYPPSIQMYHLIEKYSDEYDLPKWVIYNISYKETRYRGPLDWCYNPYRTSNSGSLGSMQIMPMTSRSINGEVSKTKLKFDLEYNISTSIKLLKKLYEKWGDWEIVCGCYNTGKPIINEYARYCANFRDYEKNWIRNPN